MFIYAAIFIACLVAAVVIPWLYHMVSGTGKVVHQTIISLAGSGSTSQLGTNPTRTSKKGVPAPFDWTSHGAPGTLVLAHAGQSETRHDFGGDNSYYGPRKAYSEPVRAKVRTKNAGWLQREDRSLPTGSAYKVTRRESRDPNLISKPKSWK